MKLKFNTIFIAIIFIFSTFTTYSYADTAKTDDKLYDVTLIYVHGVQNSDFMASFDHATIMYEKLKGKNIGPYKVSDYKIAYWGALARNNDAFKVYYQGLTQINAKNNKKHSVANTLNPINILTTPFKDKNSTLAVAKDLYEEDGVALYNKGSDASAILMRSITNDFAYDLVWLLSKNDSQGAIIDGIKYNENDEGNNLEAVYNKIEDQINQTNGNYILVGDSAGCIAAFKFVVDRLNKYSDFNKHVNITNSEKIYHTNENIYADKFVGLITIASPINTFLASDLENAYKKYMNPKTKKESFINFLLNEKNPTTGKGHFWANVAHRNDPVATDITEKILVLKGDGFISSNITKGGIKEKFLDKTNLLKISDSNVLKAHRWYLDHWVEVIDLINENFNLVDVVEEVEDEVGKQINEEEKFEETLIKEETKPSN